MKCSLITTKLLLIINNSINKKYFNERDIKSNGFE